jgi:hypothetical protein
MTGWRWVGGGEYRRAGGHCPWRHGPRLTSRVAVVSNCPGRGISSLLALLRCLSVSPEPWRCCQAMQRGCTLLVLLIRQFERGCTVG